MNPSTSTSQGANRVASPRTLAGLDWFNFLLADVQTGVGPFLAIFLAGVGWNEERVGIALMVGGIAGIVTQTPAGWLVDRLRCRRCLLAVGILALAAGSLIVAFFPTFWPVMLGQVLIGGPSSIFIPCVGAISLGIVGRQMFDCRQGRNQGFNSAGNVFAALAMGALGWWVSNRAIFFYVAAMALPTLLCLRLIRPEEIDNDLARGGGEEIDGKQSGIRTLFADYRMAVFSTCAVMFHFANAAMLPLLGEMLSKGKGRRSMMFMAACVIVTQLVIALTAGWIGRKASAWGRKPLLLIGFGVLPLRGLLYTLSSHAGFLIAVQLLDGIGAGIFGVVSVLVIADLTRGTGRFNLAQGVIATAVGIGASISQAVAGWIVHHAGYNAGFLFLSAVAALALMILWTAMPETKQQVPRTATLAPAEVAAGG